jgi:hypothetical protein
MIQLPGRRDWISPSGPGNSGCVHVTVEIVDPRFDRRPTFNIQGWQLRLFSRRKQHGGTTYSSLRSRVRWERAGCGGRSRDMRTWPESEGPTKYALSTLRVSVLPPPLYSLPLKGHRSPVIRGRNVKGLNHAVQKRPRLSKSPAMVIDLASCCLLVSAGTLHYRDDH